MLDTEKQKLLDGDSEYLSIGITEGGIPRSTVGVPWELTAHAFNMKTPDVYLSAEDINDESIMNMLAKYHVMGCYIWTPLDDYSFLSRFPEIRDINIKCGDSIRNLDFLKELKECSMLFLQNARLKNLDVILNIRKTHTSVLGGFKCVGLYNCEVEDLSGFEREKVAFSEFLIWQDKNKNERERWKVISAATWRYYDI